LLAGLAAGPIVTAATDESLAQTVGCCWTPQQAQAALKDAKGTKPVLLGTAAGPVPGRSREMTSHVMLSDGSAYVLDCGMGVTNQFAFPSALSSRSSSRIIMLIITLNTGRC